MISKSPAAGQISRGQGAFGTRLKMLANRCIMCICSIMSVSALGATVTKRRDDGPYR